MFAPLRLLYHIIGPAAATSLQNTVGQRIIDAISGPAAHKEEGIAAAAALSIPTATLATSFMAAAPLLLVWASRRKRCQ